MRISVVVPVFNQEKDVISFVESVESKLKHYTDDFGIIVTTNQDFNYVETLHQRLPDYVDLVALKLTDDYQQVVMAGVDRAEGDATIIMTPLYEVDLIDDMIEDWQNGKQIVCLRRKHGKFGKFITRIRLRIYNVFLFLFGDIFSIGILKDAQLLDKEIVDKMRDEQDMAHRFRTMYAPLDYNTSVIDIEHPVEKFETRGVPQFDFWLGVVGAFITLLASITCIILAVALAAPIWAWTLFLIFWLIFEFLFIALLVNATARVKIGILHNVDADGKIYNVVQEYFGVKNAVYETNVMPTIKKVRCATGVQNIATIENDEKAESNSRPIKQQTKKNTQKNKSGSEQAQKDNLKVEKVENTKKATSATGVTTKKTNSSLSKTKANQNLKGAQTASSTSSSKKSKKSASDESKVKAQSDIEVKAQTETVNTNKTNKKSKKSADK